MWDISKYGVLFPDCTVRNDNTPCRIVGYYDDGVVVEETLTKKLVLTRSECLEPIKITENVLVTNNFESVSSSYYWNNYVAGVHLTKVVLENNELWWWFMALNNKSYLSIRGYIRYLHQLELIIGIIGAKLEIFVD